MGVRIAEQASSFVLPSSFLRSFLPSLLSLRRTTGSAYKAVDIVRSWDREKEEEARSKLALVGQKNNNNQPTTTSKICKKNMYKGLAQAQWLDVNGNMSNIKKRTILLGPFFFARTLSFVPTACACCPNYPMYLYYLSWLFGGPVLSVSVLACLAGLLGRKWRMWVWKFSSNKVVRKWIFVVGGFFSLLAARWTDWTRPLNQTRRFWIDRARAYKKIPVYGEGEKKTGGEALIFGQSVSQYIM